MFNYSFFRSMFSNRRRPVSSGQKLQSSTVQLELLESRFVPTVSAVFSSGLLTITGDSAANTIDITYSTVSSIDYLIVRSSGATIFDGTPTGNNIASSAVASISLDAGDGDDSIDFSAVADSHGFLGLDNAITIAGGAGADTVVGSEFGDIINGGAGNDSLTGGSGSDLYAYVGSFLGSDTVTEAADSDADSLYFGFFGAAVTIDLSSTSAQNVGGSTTITLSSSDGIENLTGSGFSDSLTGNARDNNLFGAAGNDTLAGAAGNDSYVFLNGSGNDTVSEPSSSDLDILDFSGASSGVTIDLSSTTTQTWVTGSSLTLSDGTSIEQLIGSAYADTLTGNTRSNIFIGGSGNDTISGADGDDSIFGDAGDDSLLGGSGNDIYYFNDAAQGSDILVESSSAGSDMLDFASSDVGVTLSLASTSSQSWGDGTISLSSVANFESIKGSYQNDLLTGNSADNYLWGGFGNDTLSSGDGNDTLDGSIGDDSMTGGNGSDTYFFYLPPDFIGAIDLGADQVIESSNADEDLLSFIDVATGITLDLSSTSAQDWGEGTITLSSSSGIEDLAGSNFADSITGNTRNNNILGFAGNDTLFGGSGNDRLYGDFGNDSLSGGDGDDAIDGAWDNDTIAGGDGMDVLVGGYGVDDINGGNGSDALVSSLVYYGFDLTVAAAKVDAVMSRWADAIQSYANRVDNVTGEVGAPDPLSAGTRLQTGAGEAVIDDVSADTLTGAAGTDLFLFDVGEDTLSDLDSGEDSIDIG